MQPITITNSDYRRFSNEIPTYEGRNFTVIEGGLERASLARIELCMHHFLETLSLSMQERYDLVKEADSVFGKYGYRFQKEPLFPLMVEGTSIDVPAHAIIHSTVLDNMMSDYAEITPVISLPTGFSVEKFQFYLNSLAQHTEFKTIEESLEQRATADRISYHPTSSNRMAQWNRTPEALRQILSMLEYNIDPVTADIIASFYLNDYIRFFLGTKTLAMVCEELQPIKEDLRKYNINLTLLNFVSGADLIELEKVIPNVAKLFMHITNTSIFPAVWLNTLHTLTLHSRTLQQTTTIPNEVLANLRSLTLQGIWLSDYSVLDNRQKLQELFLYDVNISKVPVGCPLLQRFGAATCSITDFSALDNHPCLKECSFYDLKSLIKVPKGCLNLEIFKAVDCPIANFSGLNDLPNLQNYNFECLPHLTSLPTGCGLLQDVFIKNCPNLSEINSLSNSKKLQTCYFFSIPLVTVFPTGCLNLNKVGIDDCPLIENFSGLDNLPCLTECCFEKLPLITATPQNCPNLKRFDAINCQKLENFSGLNNLSNLDDCQLHSLPLLTTAPSNCPNLHTLFISKCPELKETSGLKVCHKLKHFGVPSWQPNYKEIYLKSIFPEQKEEDEGTIRAMILKNPVTMTPELERYYKAVTGGCKATLAQLKEILTTIRGAE